MKSAKEYHLDNLEFWNKHFIPKDPELYAIKKLIELHGHLKIDVPAASDSNGTFEYARYSVGSFLKQLLNQKANEND